MVSIGADARSFNQTAEKVVTTTQQIAQKVQQVGTPRSVAFSRGAGLASDPGTFFADLSEKHMSASAATIKREAEEARRLDQIQRDKKRSMAAQQREQIALGRSAAANNQRFVQEAMREEAAALGVGAKNMSALGGAAKMFAGFLTADFIRSKAVATMEYASMIGALSTRLNVSTTDLQAWDKALKQNGSSLKEVEPILDRLNKNRVLALSGGVGSDRQADAFSQLGIGADQLKTLGTTDLAMLIGKSFEGGGSEQMIAALQRVGGDGATALVEAFQSGLPQAVQAVKDSGDVMTSETIARLKAIGDTWMQIGQSIASGFGTLLAPVLQFATDLVETIIAIPKSIAAFVGAASVDTFSHPIEALKAGADAFNQVWKDGFKADEEREKKIKEAAEFKAKTTSVEVDNKKEAAKQRKEAEALERQVQRQVEREMSGNARLGKHSVSSFQQMGGFLGNFGLAAGPEVAAMNANVRSEDHLRQIKEHLLKKKQGDFAGTNSDVDF
jgi:hypothetical protein